MMVSEKRAVELEALRHACRSLLESLNDAPRAGTPEWEELFALRRQEVERQLKVLSKRPDLLTIDRPSRTLPEMPGLKPSSFWRGPSDGDGVEGIGMVDYRSIALNEVDLSEVVLIDGICGADEEVIDGVTFIHEGGQLNEEMRRKLMQKAGHIRLDLGVYNALMAHPERIPESWKKGSKEIYFDDPVRGPNGGCFLVGFQWLNDRWVSCCHCAILGWRGDARIAVLLAEPVGRATNVLSIEA